MHTNALKKFAQVFIAIDEMTLENGCLRIVPKSHTLGMLDHEDIVWNSMSHKKRATYKAMKEASNKFGVKEIQMSPGDMLIFNHRLLHGYIRP